MANDNVMAAVSLFNDGGPWGYRSASVADFNTLSDTGAFGAYVTAIVNGEYQRDLVPAPQYLWGTLNPSAPNTGWSITLEDNVDSPGQAAVTGRVGIGSDVAVVQYNISGPSLPSFVERPMQIGLWYVPESSGIVYLTINGAVVASSPILDDPFAPNANPVACGILPVTPSTQASGLVDIVSCGYTYAIQVNDRDDVGYYAAHAFRDARAAVGCGPVYSDVGLDWVHRYSARTLGANAPGSIVKAPTSAQLRTDEFPNQNGYAAVPNAPWQDLGNTLVSDLGFQVVPYNPVNLERIGNLITPGDFVILPCLVGRKNVDWYAGGAYAFPAA